MSDIDAFVAYRRDPRVAEFQSWDIDYDAAQARQLIDEQPTGTLTAGRWLQLGLHALQTGELVGDVALHTRSDQPDCYELGITLAVEHQGRGLAAEACARVLDYLFADVSAHRVEARCDVRNIRSGRLLRRLGLRHESRLIDADWCKGEWTSLDTYAVLAAETHPSADPPSSVLPGVQAAHSPEHGQVGDHPVADQSVPDHPVQDHLVGDHPVRGVSFLGVHTTAFAAMVVLYRDVYGAPLIHRGPGAAWFRMGDGAELHVYATSDSYHQFFGAAPVPGLFVADFAGTERDLTQAGVEWLTEPDTAGGRIWRHYRAPDGNVYEVMGIAPRSRDVPAHSPAASLPQAGHHAQDQRRHGIG